MLATHEVIRSVDVARGEEMIGVIDSVIIHLLSFVFCLRAM